ncbi:MAG: tripartite tricarboxylate transporter substrate binding protein [Pseudomonadota bacterium]
MLTSIPRRLALSAILAAGALLAGTSAMAQAWPTKQPIRLINPYAPGGTSDILARAFAVKLQERLGQTVIVENKPGAGGNIGTDYVAKSPPDGYTLVLGNIGPMSVNSSMYKTMPYDAQKDLAPISLLLAYPNIILVNNDFAPKNLKELIAYAKTHDISYAGNGVGTSLHLTGEMFARKAGIKLTHIPYKGDVPGLTDVMGGSVPMNISPIASPIPQIKAGKVRALAVTGPQRSEQLPDVPTVSEAGLPGFEVTGWIGLLAAAGTPTPIMTRLVSETTYVMQTPEMKRLVTEMASYVPPMGPDYFAKFIASETAKWREVVQGANIKAE